MYTIEEDSTVTFSPKDDQTRTSEAAEGESRRLSRGGRRLASETESRAKKREVEAARAASLIESLREFRKFRFRAGASRSADSSLGRSIFGNYDLLLRPSGRLGAAMQLCRYEVLKHAENLVYALHVLHAPSPHGASLAQATGYIYTYMYYVHIF